MKKEEYNLNIFSQKPVEKDVLQKYLKENLPGMALGVYEEEGFPLFYINDRMLRCLGYESLEDFNRANNGCLLCAFHPEERNREKDIILQQLEEEGEFDITFRMRKKDGSFCWFESQGSNCVLEGGERIWFGYCMDITKLKEQESQLLLYRKASLGGAFLVRLDEDFTLLYGNDIYYQVHEYTPETMKERIGNRCREYVHPEDLPFVRSVIAEALEAGQTGVEWEMRVITGKGNIRWVLASAAFEHKGEEILVDGFVIDNTQHHLIAEEAARKEKWYQIAVSQTSTTVWEFDLENHCILLNDESERRHGYRKKVENVPEGLIESGYIHPDSWDDFRDMYNRLYKGENHVQADIKTRTLDGKGWWWERIMYLLEFDNQGKPYKAVAVGENITKEKENELKYQTESRKRLELSAEVQYREQLFDALSHNVDNIYILLGSREQEFLQYVSPNLERILGIRPEMLKEDLDCLFGCIAKEQDAQRWANDLKREKQTRETYHEICFENALTGRQIWMETEMRELNIGGAKGLLLILNDRTEAKKHEKQLGAALEAAESANEAKSRFLSSMSHDIRTPMNAIIGMAEIAVKHLHDEERVKDCLKKILLSSRHLLGLINDVLDMSRIESGKMTLHDDVVSVDDVIDNVMTIMQLDIKTKKQMFSLSKHDLYHQYFYCDALRLRQILLNILSNANKFTPEGGKITFEVDEMQESAGRARLNFKVTDTGIGMKQEFLAHIFDAFLREKDGRVDKTEGSGLGMAITKRIVDMLGGVITVESREGSGSAFFVSIPLKLAEEPPEVPNAGGLQRDDCDFSGKRFLLVEDNELNREIALELFSSTGAEIICTCDGREGVAEFEQSQPGYYDLILMDIQMPVMNGYEAAEKIRSLMRPDALTVPICAMTADAFAEDVLKAKEAGMNEHVAKPLDIEAVNHKISKLFN